MTTDKYDEDMRREYMRGYIEGILKFKSDVFMTLWNSYFMTRGNRPSAEDLLSLYIQEAERILQDAKNSYKQ